MENTYNEKSEYIPAKDKIILLEKYDKLSHLYETEVFDAKIGLIFGILIIVYEIVFLAIDISKPFVFLILTAISSFIMASFLITVLVVFAKKRNLMKDISKLNYYYKKAYEKYQENDKEDLKECIVEFIPVIGPATYGTFMNNHNQRRRGILKSVIDGTNYELVQIGVSRPYVKSRHILKYEFLAFISTRILLSVFITLAGIAYFIPFDILKIYLPCVFIGFIVLLGFFNSFYYISMLKYFKFAVTSYKDYIK